MGVCSYCYRHKSEHDECFSWQEAANFCSISGPCDPKRLEAKAREDAMTPKQKQARAEFSHFIRNYQQ